MPCVRASARPQGDFFVHFLDSAEEELTKPVGEISKARLQAKLDIALRQSAMADPYSSSLTCGLLPYNLTNQVNTLRGGSNP